MRLDPVEPRGIGKAQPEGEPAAGHAKLRDAVQFGAQRVGERQPAPRIDLRDLAGVYSVVIATRV